MGFKKRPKKTPPLFSHLDAEQKEAFYTIHYFYSANAVGPRPATSRIVHYWGQFTDELPKSLQPDGPNGHQYFRCKTIEAAEKKAQEIRAAVFKLYPDSFEWASDEWYRWMIHDMRQMTLVFEKET